MRWYKKTKGRFMLQWGWPIFLSLGFHIDFRKWYIDLHLIFFIITIGNVKNYAEYQSWWASRSKP